MEIYLIRHTTPLVEKGICYGQSDLDVTETFAAEYKIIQSVLPDTILQVHSSPLKRCSLLAEKLFPAHTVNFNNDLKEINCGKWEMQSWDDIAQHEIDPWMNDFVNVQIPQGESYIDLYKRVKITFDTIVATNTTCAIVAHGGVLRSILSYITNTALIDSFNQFKIHYGCVVKVAFNQGEYSHQFCSNITSTAETHKPKAF